MVVNKDDRQISLHPCRSEEVEGLAFEDLRKRVQLGSAALPSVCFYTFMNHYNR